MSDRSLTEYVERFKGCRVGVVGDFMLDRYVWGRATRISQEAPVPVVQVQRETSSPGGAANVVRNLVELGASALAFGVVGQDRHADTLRSLLAEGGADLRGLISLSDRATTAKTRIIAGNQQTVRVDREDTTPLASGQRDRLVRLIDEAAQRGEMDALIAEDYAKGVLDRDVLSRIVHVCNTRGIPVSLDPHASNAFNVKGLRAMTPNRAEAFALAGCYYQSGCDCLEEDAPLIDVGRRLTKLWSPDLILVTLGARGMALFEGTAAPLLIPTRARHVFDVSGAGDTVMAVFSLALLAGAPPSVAARLANHAAGIVVGVMGTAAVSVEELCADLCSESGR